jgi:hypothetical protein
MVKDMEQVLQLVVVFFAALATGALLVNWVGLGGAMSRLSASTYVEFHQATNHTSDPYMPIVVGNRWWCSRRQCDVSERLQVFLHTVSRRASEYHPACCEFFISVLPELCMASGGLTVG